MRERFDDKADARFRMPDDEGKAGKAEVAVDSDGEGDKSFDDVGDAASVNGWSAASTFA